MECIYCGGDILKNGEFCNEACEDAYYIALCEGENIPEVTGTAKGDYLKFHGEEEEQPTLVDVMLRFVKEADICTHTLNGGDYAVTVGDIGQIQEARHTCIKIISSVIGIKLNRYINVQDLEEAIKTIEATK